jgi:hypothetical protein
MWRVDQIVSEPVRLLGALRATGCDIFIDREDDCYAGWSRLKRSIRFAGTWRARMPRAC